MGKYLANISQDAKKVEKEQLEFAAETAKFQIGHDLLTIKKDLNAAKAALSAAESRVPYSTEAILDARREVAALQEMEAEVKEIEKDLFQ